MPHLNRLHSLSSVYVTEKRLIVVLKFELFLFPPSFPLQWARFIYVGTAHVKSILTCLVHIVCFATGSFFSLGQHLLSLETNRLTGHTNRCNLSYQICSVNSFLITQDVLEVKERDNLLCRMSVAFKSKTMPDLPLARSL